MYVFAGTHNFDIVSGKKDRNLQGKFYPSSTTTGLKAIKGEFIYFLKLKTSIFYNTLSKTHTLHDFI